MKLLFEGCYHHAHDQIICTTVSLGITYVEIYLCEFEKEDKQLRDFIDQQLVRFHKKYKHKHPSQKDILDNILNDTYLA